MSKSKSKRDAPDACATPRALYGLALLVAAACAAIALARVHALRNETFDLAFYARWAWGVGRGDGYQPLTNSPVLGLHAAFVLKPLGWLTRLAPAVPLLLVSQALAVALAAAPLARLAARRLAHPAAGYLAALCFWLYPPVATMASYEFHPSALALWPLAWALDALDRRAPLAHLAAALALAGSCREDAALVAGCTALLLTLDAREARARRLAGLAGFALGAGWFLLYFFVVAPPLLPRRGALEAHFGSLGATPAQIARALLAHPLTALRALATPARLAYAPRLLAPLLFAPLAAPRWLVPALVPVGINLLSAFPSAAQVGSHYAALAVPFLFAAGVHGAASLLARVPPARRGLARATLALAALAAGLAAHYRNAHTPLARHGDPSALVAGARARDLRGLFALVPPPASVAAPDYALPHLCERPVLQRLPPRLTVDYLVLSLEHREGFGPTQDLWRSLEETPVRNALASRTFGLLAATPTHLLFRRGFDPRAYARGRYLHTSPLPHVVASHRELGPSLWLAAWGARPARDASDRCEVTLVLVARDRWPHDMALELGWGPLAPSRAASDRDDPAHTLAALPFDGMFSPAHVREGELARTQSVLPARCEAALRDGLYFGARRQDGSRLDRAAPHWTRLDEAPR